jgi:hypothetical protein
MDVLLVVHQELDHSHLNWLSLGLIGAAFLVGLNSDVSVGYDAFSNELLEVFIDFEFSAIEVIGSVDFWVIDLDVLVIANVELGNPQFALG